jgi:hypothetical protein
MSSVSDTDSTTVACSAYASLPILSEDNFTDWDMQVVAYLTGSHNHVQVIMPSRQSGGKALAPIQPAPASVTADTNMKKEADTAIAEWEKSERVVLGCLMATVGKLHCEAVLKHQQSGSALWDLYSKICNYHKQRDASPRYEAWMQFLTVHKSATDSYMTYYQRIKGAYNKINWITPAGQSAEEQAKELKLFTLLSNLPHDNSLCLSLTMQRDLTLVDATSAMLCLDTSKKLAVSRVEQAHAAFGSNCWTCGEKDHVARKCLHQEVVQQLFARWQNAGNSNGGRSWKGKGKDTARNTTGDNARSSANIADVHNSTNVNNSANPNTTSADRACEAAGVVALFLSNELHVTDAWLCDSGASSSMSGDRSAFRSLADDQHTIWLADGKVIYSKGLGSIQFLSNCGYIITIDNVLFVPHLSVNLFSANKFAKEHCKSHSKVVECPKRKWVNWQTGAIKFMATIHANGLAYLDWRVAPWVESINVLMEELHACLNHLPFLEVRRLVWTQPVNGVPDQITGTYLDSNFCKDCVNGKLMHTPHTRPATHTTTPLQWVYTDLHGPVPTHRCHGHFYWVLFIDDYL